MSIYAHKTTSLSLPPRLIEEDGYLCDEGDCNNLVLTAPEWISDRVKFMYEKEKPDDMGVVGEALEQSSRFFLAHVHESHHFVLVTDVDVDRAVLHVNDPFYNTSEYPYTNVSDLLTYALDQTVDESFPLFKQCDERWGDDLMETETVCQVGCLMSSISMALNGTGIAINGNATNPGSLNEWLRENGGYDDANDLKESVVPLIDPERIVWPDDGMHAEKDLSFQDLQQYLAMGRVLIVNVMEGRHFVLMTGVDDQDGDTLFVNDPGFNVGAYSYADDAVGFRIFDMK